MASDKRHAYLIVRSDVEGFSPGKIILEKQSKGFSWTELFMDKKFKHLSFNAQRIGTCYIVGGKVQFEEPPLKPGMLTDFMMGRGIKKQPKKTKRK